MSFQEVKSVAEGLDHLDDHPGTLVTYVPITLSHELQALRDDIIQGNKACELNGLESDPACTLRNAFQNHANLLPIAGDPSEIPGLSEMRLLGGAEFQPQSSRAPFQIACGRRELKVSTFIVQGNDNYGVEPVMHPDECDLTICVYLEGKGLRYKMPDGGIISDKNQRSRISMHRGLAHEDVSLGSAIAVEHSGFRYGENEDRASFHIALNNNLMRA